MEKRKFKIRDHKNFKVQKYIPKGYIRNLTNKVIAIKNFEDISSWIYPMEILNGEEIITRFINKDFKERNRLTLKLINHIQIGIYFYKA